MKTAQNEIDEARDVVERLTRNFLRERGWEYTSNTPGCLWLWQKQLPDGRTVLVDDGTALSIQDALEFTDRDSDFSWERNIMATANPPALITAGVIANELGVALHRVIHVLATREHIKPSARVGTLRVYDRQAVAMVRHELHAIDARRCSKGVVRD